MGEYDVEMLGIMVYGVLRMRVKMVIKRERRGGESSLRGDLKEFGGIEKVWKRERRRC